MTNLRLFVACLVAVGSVAPVLSEAEVVAVTGRVATPGVVADDSPSAQGDCDGLLMNHDGSFENAYTWVQSGVELPDFGAFAEQFTGDYDLCEIQLHLTQIGNQSGQTMDVYVWDDDNTGKPGAVLLHLTDIDPGSIAVWPEVTRVDVPVSISVEHKWWVGWWGNWPDDTAGWFVAADESGPGGKPSTRIAPGIGYPSGWHHPNVVSAWSDAKSLGIQVIGTGVSSVGDPFAGGVYTLARPSPNPFLRSTEIELVLERRAQIELSVYDAGGRRVKTLVEGLLPGGLHRITWDGRGDGGREVPSGIYYVGAAGEGRKSMKRVARLR